MFESFLQTKWEGLAKDLGPPPTGPDAIAIMRLVTQVQDLPLQQKVVSGWSELSRGDRKVLEREMALTGAVDQSYERVASAVGGPAFLVYYSPAFMRVAARKDAVGGMRFLAEIYRQARTLWPFSRDWADVHVTILIGQIKDHTPQHMMDGYEWGDGWILVKRNNREAAVEKCLLYTLTSSEPDSMLKDFRVLRFWPPNEVTPGGQEEVEDYIEELEELREKRMGDEQASAPPARALGFARVEEPVETGIRRQLRLGRAEQQENVALWA